MEVNMAQNPEAYIYWHVASFFSSNRLHLFAAAVSCRFDKIFEHSDVTRTKFVQCVPIPVLLWQRNNKWGEKQNKEKKTWLSFLVPS